ncbi:MAG: hypothetical protein V4631_19475 [Pseudomonadota bacterium]
MDDRDYKQPGKTEPGFETAQGADTVDVQPLFPELDDMPAWLKQPAAPAPERSSWKQTLGLWAGSLAALALAFAGTMWLFDEHNADRAMDVVARSAQAPVAPAPVAQPAPQPARTSTLPPLVLLQPAPGAAVADPVTPPPVAVVKPAPLPPKAPVAKLAPKAVVAKVAAKPVPAKLVPKAVPVAPRKALVAKSAVPKVRPKLVAVVSKSAPAPKRAPPPVLTKAKPKLVAGARLPPAREPVKPATTAPTPVARCQPGGLARDC